MEKQEQSHPSRMRGLKLKYQKISMKADLVAPLTGAWIKTGSIIVARKRMNVASLVDAWIKIFFGMVSGCRISRGCVD